jgi:hypothetical protein
MIRNKQQLLELLYVTAFAQMKPDAPASALLEYAARVELDGIEYADVTANMREALETILGDVSALSDTEEEE